jgi:hypothetical protein
LKRAMAILPSCPSRWRVIAGLYPKMSALRKQKPSAFA